jgi:hypothetical protein
MLVLAIVSISLTKLDVQDSKLIFDLVHHIPGQCAPVFQGHCKNGIVLVSPEYQYGAKSHPLWMYCECTSRKILEASVAE